MCVRNVRVLLTVLVSVAASSVAAQQVDGLELERRGLYEQAFGAYRQVLETDPVNVTTWLGVERVLTQLGRLESLIRLADTVLAAVPDNRFVREIQLRAWSAAGPLDSLAAAATRWIASVPEAPDPYRQWAFAVARGGDNDGAIEILETGRARLGPTALASELARLHASAGDWPAAAREWSTAVALSQAYVMSAVAALQDAPVEHRENVLAALTSRSGASIASRRLGAELLVMWGRGVEGWSLLAGTLSSDRTESTAALGRFIERTRRVEGTDPTRARGYALERLAELSTGSDAERARLDAAQAFADAGELSSARRMLEWLATTPSAEPDDARGAMATVIRVTIELGRVEEAERQFLAWRNRLGGDEVEDLRHRLGRAWIAKGNLERAEQILLGDTSVGTLALLGWVRLYGGDLVGAVELFRAAGPYASSREETTRRTAMLALMQQIDADTVPGLGRALFSLANGDTAAAVDGLSETAGMLPRRGGRAGVLALAGELAVESGDYVRAESLLLAALAADSSGPAAPAAELAVAVVLSRTKRVDQATERLEHLILSYTDSAVVPEARRLLDQLIGAVPKS